MHALHGRMNYLRTGEAIAAVAIPVVAVYRWLESTEPVWWEIRIAGLVLISYILLQGTLYWHLKLRSFNGHGPLPTYFYSLYRGFKYSNVAGISLMLLAMLLGAASATRADLGWAAAMLALVVLEQINYYHYQLMYDTRNAVAGLVRNRRLRKAALAIDLERTRPKARAAQH